MISTKNFISTHEEIKSGWVFNYYLDLPEKLSGQDLQITSVFNPLEKTPSMYIYLDANSNEYKFKDFSTGKQGSKIDIVQALFNLTYSKTLFKITEDYNDWIMQGGKFDDDESFTPAARYQVDYIHKREWNTEDAAYWLKFNIGTTALRKYNVQPIEYYNMVKASADGIKKITINQSMIYGYYNNQGECYKIYQPGQKQYKFIKITGHLQGYDQLAYKADYLIVCSSLKDAMCVMSFGFNVEVVAPDSENTLIKPYIVENFKSKYKKVFTLLDNDSAGQEAMDKYKKLHNLTPIIMTSEKDISDAVSIYGAEAVKPKLFNLIKKAI
jgi:hypothetical protein